MFSPTYPCLNPHLYFPCQIVALGFTPDLAKAALDRFKGDIHKTIDEMLRHGGVPPYLAEAAAAIASTSSSSSSVSSSASTDIKASTSKGALCSILKTYVIEN